MAMMKTIKIVLCSIIIIFLLLLGVEFWLGNKIKVRLEQGVSTRTKGAVCLKIGGARVNLLGRTVKLKRVDVMGDSVLLAKHNIPFYTLKGIIDELTIKGIHWKKRDTGVVVQTKKLVLKSSSFEITGKTAGKTDEQVFRGKMGEILNALEIGEINISLEDIRYKQWKKRNWTRTTGRNIHVGAEGFTWNVMSGALARMFSCEALRVSSERVQRELLNGNLVLNVEGLYVGSREGKIKIDSVCLLPLLPKGKYAIKTGQDWTQVKVSNVTAEQWDFGSLLTARLLKVGYVGVQDVTVNSFKNRKIDQPDRVKRLFYEGVQQFPLGLEVQRIDLLHVHVAYEELSKSGETPGKITFNDLSGEFQGLTNVVKANEPFYKLIVRGKLMNAGEFRTTFCLPVASSNGRFQIEGEMGEMDLALLNPMITPLTKIEVESGKVDRMKFRISGDAREATTEMAFLYEDFVITLLREKDGRLKKASTLSDIINGVLVRRNNPERDRVRSGKAVVKRDIYRSQFNYLWHSLFAGIGKIVEG